ncbi:MAG: SpoIIE family protein phosphatase [Coriobacteriia bacterium]|nr:SpoIIE family protein phosphatase [Coriobacteriia bacterium]
MRIRRVGIGRKLVGIYLIIALPLIVALGLPFLGRYRDQVRLALFEREELATLAADGFQSEMRSLSSSLAFVGRHAEHGSEEAIAEDLRELGSEHPVTEAVLLDSAGRVSVSAGGRLEGRDFSDRREVQDILADRGRFVLSDVVSLNGEAGFWAVRAVEEGERGAAVAAFISLRAFNREAPVPLHRGFVHIVDSTGRLVYGSRDPAYIELDVNFRDALFVREALAGRVAGGFSTHPVTGEEVLASDVPIREFGWGAGSAVPSAAVLAGLREQLITVVAVVVAVQLVVIALVWVLSRMLVRPLSELVEDSRAVGAGRFDQPIVAPTGDEIEKLAGSLDQMRRDLKRYVEGLSALSQNARSLSASLTQDALDRTVVSGARELFGATEVWILREQEGRLVPRLLHGVELDARSLGDASATIGMLADVMRTGSPRVIADVTLLPFTDWARRAAARDIRSVALLPLSSRTARYGILGLAAPQVMPWAEEEREGELLGLFAGQVADALENVGLFEQVQRLADDNERLYERERDVALRLQESLLRMPVSVPGLRFHHLYRSAVEATLVGGDFYDLFELGHQRLGVAVGDVSGKGLEAATLISFVKSSLRAYAYEGYSPARVLASINEAVGRLTQPSEFVTVFFGVYDCPTGRLRYCSAGHPPAIVRRTGATGEAPVETLPTDSPLLGAFSGATFEDGEAILNAGDTLLLYTDGVTEARSPEGGLFGLERLAEAVREAPAEGDLTAAVFARVEAYSEGRIADDVAMLALTPEASLSCEAPMR